MNETVCIDLQALESEQQAVIAFFERQIDAFRAIKRAMEKAQWVDDKYDCAVDCLNEIGQALASILQTLSNGKEVYVISELIPLAEEYLSLAAAFPHMQ